MYICGEKYVLHPMGNIIKLLPDALANQIAAGEVVQRPASVVKELMENALDAKANKITLIIKDGGKSSIQIIDDGSGMSETDARLSFERHATSKIKTADDLFAIKTMGFRGEALASIAAVAQVELKTRQPDLELGTRILIEGSKVITQEPCQTPVGTSITVRNLFFNVPARKQFLKTDARELQMAEDEFVRIALAHPEIHFVMFINDREAYKLPVGNLRQRIVNVLGNTLNQKLVPVEEDTDIIKLSGFVGTPDSAKKRRGQQYLFVNDRFIKSHYLNHAVSSAYEEVLPDGHFPFYAIFLQIDPDKIDVNVHPTKQEIKFEDEKIVYNYMKVATRHALSKYHVTPTLDFDQDRIFSVDASRSSGRESFRGGSDYSSGAPSSNFQREEKNEWVNYYENLFQPKGTEGPSIESSDDEMITIPSISGDEEGEAGLFGDRTDWSVPEPYQIHRTYVVCHIRSGIIIVDQQAAHERILYERYLEWMDNGQAPVQQELFPKVVQLQGSDIAIMEKILPELGSLGLMAEPFGQSEFIIHGTPSLHGMQVNSEELLLDLIDQYKNNLNLDLSVKEKTACAMARSTAMRRGKKLNKEEMQTLADQLFSCELPYKSPTGRKCFITLELEDLEKRFKN